MGCKTARRSCEYRRERNRSIMILARARRATPATGSPLRPPAALKFPPRGQREIAPALPDSAPSRATFARGYPPPVGQLRHRSSRGSKQSSCGAWQVNRQARPPVPVPEPSAAAFSVRRLPTGDSCGRISPIYPRHRCSLRRQAATSTGHSAGKNVARAPISPRNGAFLLGFLGLAISLWPNIVPRSVNFHEAPAPQSNQVFLLLGMLILLPVFARLCGLRVLGASWSGGRGYGYK